MYNHTVCQKKSLKKTFKLLDPHRTTCFLPFPHAIASRCQTSGGDEQMTQLATTNDPVYETFTDLEHVLQRPHMYLGPCDKAENEGPTFKWEGEKLVPHKYVVTTSPVWEKLLDEALTNAMDAATEDSSVTRIAVGICAETGKICVHNDGRGVPVRPLNDQTSLLVPEVVFGQMRSSSHYSADSFSGGMNGVGIKLANICSDPTAGFTVRTLHPDTKKSYEQTWTGHMSETTGPSVKASSNKRGWVEVCFTPDYARFGETLPLTEGIVEMLRARVYDACACTPPNVKVSLDGRPIPIRGASQYAALTFSPAKILAHDSVSVEGVVRFEVYVADGAGERSMWFVNGIRTRGGGTLQEHVVRKVADIMNTKARERSKNAVISVRPALIKERIGFVCHAKIAGARYPSQAKDALSTPVSKFGFVWSPSKAFVANIEKSSLIDDAIRSHATADEAKAKKAVKRKVLPSKYDPAIRAGKKGAQCTLILTEGDSAKATVVSAMDVIGRDHYGILPLRGKIINGMANTATRLLENEEVKAIASILGIEPFREEWTDAEIDALTYSRGVMVVADADVDGTHITGLVVCLLMTICPAILKKRPTFVRKFASPILQARLDGNTMSFLTEKEFQVWRASQTADALRRARVDYFKGLGTWSSADARRFFARMPEHTLHLSHDGDVSVDTLRLFFDPGRADARKHMLIGYDEDTTPGLDYADDGCSIGTFLDREMIHYSLDDIARSIPSIDSFKPGARKVMWAFRKRGYTSRIKVAQAGAGVAEISQYHHGETSLIETICGLAQTHVGTNNLNLLVPKVCCLSFAACHLMIVICCLSFASHPGSHLHPRRCAGAVRVARTRSHNTRSAAIHLLSPLTSVGSDLPPRGRRRSPKGMCRRRCRGTISLCAHNCPPVSERSVRHRHWILDANPQLQPGGHHSCNAHPHLQWR